MFGYIKTNKMELKHREILEYKGYYCGICMTLKEEYGNLSRLSLNFDTTFLQILLTSLYEPEDTGQMKRCISHPQKKEAVITNQISSYASAMNIILTWYKLEDDWNDDRSLKAKSMMTVIKSGFERARKKYPKQEAAVKKYLQELSEHEKVKSQDIEEMSNIFGYIMAEIFSYKEDVFAKHLYQTGFYIGKYIYIVDAFEDLAQDKEKGKYNPFLKRTAEENFQEEEFKEEIKQQLFFILGMACMELDKLPLFRNKGIIDNIMYSGITIRLNKALGEECDKEDEIKWK